MFRSPKVYAELHKEAEKHPKRARKTPKVPLFAFHTRLPTTFCAIERMCVYRLHGYYVSAILCFSTDDKPSPPRPLPPRPHLY